MRTIQGVGQPRHWRRRPQPGGPPAPEPVLRVGGRNVSWLLPTLLLIGIAAGDWNASGDFRIVTWLAVVPPFAAVVSGPVTTVVFALLCPVVYVVLDVSWEHQYQMGAGDLVVVIAGSGLAVGASWLRRRGYRHLADVERAAEATRVAVLRPIPPVYGGLETASVYLAADSAALVGGDFFEVLTTPFGPRVLLGDVQGKGASAVDAAAALLGTFREAGYHEADLTEVAVRLEQRMRRHNAYAARLGQKEDRFATAALAGFPAEGWAEGTVELIDFGHAAPLAISPRGVRRLPEGNGVPLGVGGLAAGAAFTVRRARLADDETLLLVTDGVTEARDAAGEFLPLMDRLRTYLALARRDHVPDTSPDAVVAAVVETVWRHTGGRLADDTAILAARRVPGADPRDRTPGGVSAPEPAG